MDESIADVSSDAEGKSVGSQLVFYRCKTGCVCIEYVLYLGLSFNVFMRLQQIRKHTPCSTLKGSLRLVSNCMM